MSRKIKAGNLEAEIFSTREEMGAAAARDIAGAIGSVLSCSEYCNMIFAAAPSQNEVLAALAADKSVDFRRVNAFHMDEYCGLAEDAPQRFGNFLNAAIFSKVPFHAVHYLNGLAEDVEGECARYGALLEKYPADIVCLGIGENGHIAFNDPPVADFRDPVLVKRVALDEICRRQQVHDGCFRTLDQVPKYALTLTVPALMGGKKLFCVVPSALKAEAVARTLNEPVDEACPATAMRLHRAAKLYLDEDSAGKMEKPMLQNVR